MRLVSIFWLFSLISVTPLAKPNAAFRQEKKIPFKIEKWEQCTPFRGDQTQNKKSEIYKKQKKITSSKRAKENVSYLASNLAACTRVHMHNRHPQQKTQPSKRLREIDKNCIYGKNEPQLFTFIVIFVEILLTSEGISFYCTL